MIFVIKMEHLTFAFIPTIFNPSPAPESYVHVVRLLVRYSILLFMVIILVFSMISVSIRSHGTRNIWLMLVPGLNLFILWKIGIRRTWWVFLLMILIIGFFFSTVNYHFSRPHNLDNHIFVINPPHSGAGVL